MRNGAIDGSRQTIREQILSHEAAPLPDVGADSNAAPPKPSSYSLADALADIRSSDDSCSIKGGLAKRGSIATASQEAGKSCVAKVQGATDATAKSNTDADLCGCSGAHSGALRMAGYADAQTSEPCAGWGPAQVYWRWRARRLPYLLFVLLLSMTVAHLPSAPAISILNV